MSNISLRACTKRKVVRRDIKEAIVYLSSVGREFQSVGALISKA